MAAAERISDTTSPDAAIYRPTSEQLPNPLPGIESAGRKIAWATVLSTIAGGLIPLAFREKISKSLPLRVLVSVFSAIGAGVVGGIVSSGLVLKGVMNREGKHIDAKTAYAMGQSMAMSQQEPENPMALPPVQPAPQPEQPTAPEIQTPSFAAAIPQRDPSHAAQAMNEAAQQGAPSIPTP